MTIDGAKFNRDEIRYKFGQKQLLKNIVILRSLVKRIYEHADVASTAGIVSCTIKIKRNLKTARSNVNLSTTKGLCSWLAVF